MIEPYDKQKVLARIERLNKAKCNMQYPNDPDGEMIGDLYRYVVSLELKINFLTEMYEGTNKK